jgi:hypothetical protein
MAGSVLIAGDFNATHKAWNNACSNQKEYEILPTSEPTHFPVNGHASSFLIFIVAKSR